MAVKQNNSEGNGSQSPDGTSNGSSGKTTATAASGQSQAAMSSGGTTCGANGPPNIEKNVYDLQVILKMIDVIQAKQQGAEFFNIADYHSLYQQLIRLLAKVAIPRHPHELKRFKEDIIKVGEFFAKAGEDSQSTTIYLSYLQMVCVLITAEESPSCAIAVIFQLFTDEMVAKAVQLLLSTYELVGGQTIKKTVKLLCEWLRVCNFCQNLNLWILAIMNGLREHQKFDLIYEISMEIIDPLFISLIIPVLRPKVEPIVFYILTSVKHTPEVFHKIIQRVPKVVQQLKHESLRVEETKKILQNLVDLLTALMAQFQGYDDLYKQTEECLSEFSPSFDYRSILNSAGWSNGSPGDAQLLPNSANVKVGLVNLGNTCYMNSVLQALAMTKEFSREILLCATTTPLLLKVQQLMALMLHSKRPELTPSSVLNATRPPGFSPGYQQDSSEFLGYLLETLHEQEAKSRIVDEKPQEDKKSSAIDELEDATLDREEDGASNVSLAAAQNTATTIEKTFTGQIVTTYKCLTCAWQSKNIDSFRDLQLSFPEVENDCASNYSVQDLIDYYCSPEKLYGDNQYFCEKCKKLTDAERFINVIRAPKNLILTLKHFKYDQKYHMRAKLMHKVFHDESVSLKVCSPETMEEIASVNYNLYAGVVHSGFSMDSGHYYTYASDSTDKWYKFNDSIVTQCEIGELHNLTPPNTPYILFYQMRGQSTETRPSSNKVVKVEIPSPPTLDELPSHLRDYVFRDNGLFSEEMRARNRKVADMVLRSQNGKSRRTDRGDEDDDDQSSRGSVCGENALNINMNRFIY